MTFKIGDTVYVTDASEAPGYTGMSGIVIDMTDVDVDLYVIQTDEGIIVCAEDELSADPAE